MSKVTVVGAGNVGATVANVLAHKDVVKEVVILDIKGDFAKGKALDSWQQAPIDYYSTRLVGTDDYKDTADSDIVVITAGIPRKPGEYGINDMYLGVPVKLGKNGIEKKIELDLNDDEMKLLNQSAEAVKGVMDAFNGMGLI
ncbi:unnamed protein product [Cyprideis torosa]|uniref:Lactate/malate dehydrogenase N-terminal domain-containing protein n=1 Tax=Cyprideis torosa TaxID=163714 RepID=A0A7R8ZW69_9CRUS|nr:unnamed protein product [Cyprideis torosa]CAG0904297.1 unnamed protein product [Cyprideis torosa]